MAQSVNNSHDGYLYPCSSPQPLKAQLSAAIQIAIEYLKLPRYLSAEVRDASNNLPFLIRDKKRIVSFACIE
jgi:hypothetical protein